MMERWTQQHNKRRFQVRGMNEKYPKENPQTLGNWRRKGPVFNPGGGAEFNFPKKLRFSERPLSFRKFSDPPTPINH